MIKTTFIGLALAGLTLSCNSDDRANALIEGNWNVVSRSGGDNSENNTVDLTDLKLKYVFSGTHFQYTKTDEMLAEGTFSMKKSKEDYFFLTLDDNLNQSTISYKVLTEGQRILFFTEEDTGFKTRLEKAE